MLEDIRLQLNIDFYLFKEEIGEYYLHTFIFSVINKYS